MSHSEISKSYDLVLIEWVDSVGVGSSWEAIPNKLECDEFICVSVGYLTHQTDNAIVIVPHMHPASEQLGTQMSGCGDMMIPTAAVRRMVELEAAE